jgi:hypothetical protein
MLVQLLGLQGDLNKLQFLLSLGLTKFIGAGYVSEGHDTNDLIKFKLVARVYHAWKRDERGFLEAISLF